MRNLATSVEFGGNICALVNKEDMNFYIFPHRDMELDGHNDNGSVIGSLDVVLSAHRDN
jgi:hypothetical protein